LAKPWHTPRFWGGRKSHSDLGSSQYPGPAGPSAPSIFITEPESSGGDPDHPPNASKAPRPRTSYKRGNILPPHIRSANTKNTLSPSINLELQTRGSPSLANQIPPNFGNRRRRARSTYIPKKLRYSPTYPLLSWKP
jgi:hypothetical protein